jgi:hypothetical protein
MTIDIPVYDAMRFDIRAGDLVWAEKVGTPDAISRDGFLIGGELPASSRTTASGTDQLVNEQIDGRMMFACRY